MVITIPYSTHVPQVNFIIMDRALLSFTRLVGFWNIIKRWNKDTTFGRLCQGIHGHQGGQLDLRNDFPSNLTSVVKERIVSKNV